MPVRHASFSACESYAVVRQNVEKVFFTPASRGRGDGLGTFPERREPPSLARGYLGKWRLRGVKRPQQRNNGEQPQRAP